MTISSIKQKLSPSLVYLQSLSIGVGFYIEEYQLIVTAATLVDENSIAVVKGIGMQRASTKVLLTDQAHNIAFLKKPAGMELSGIALSKANTLQPGDPVIAMGMIAPDTMITSAGQILRNNSLQYGGKTLEMHKLFDHFYTGGPLLTTEGELAGLNFSETNGNLTYNYSIPLGILIEVLEKYKPFHGSKAACCPSCQAVVAISTPATPPFFCSVCGSNVALPVKKYKDRSSYPTGKLATALVILKKDAIAICSNSIWRFHETDFTVQFNPNNLQIYIGKLPLNGSSTTALYEYLLRENDHPGSAVLGCSQDDVVLQCELFPEEMEVAELVTVLEYNFQLAARHAAVLKNEFQCREPRRFHL